MIAIKGNKDIEKKFSDSIPSLLYKQKYKKDKSIIINLASKADLDTFIENLLLEHNKDNNLMFSNQIINFANFLKLPFESLEKIKKYQDDGKMIYKGNNLSDLIFDKKINWNDQGKITSITTNHELATIFYSFDKISKSNINNIIVDHLKIKVCPYCNINFIYNRTQTKVTAHLDHFFSKSKYPLLSLCLYNLIPSCPACNTLKGDNPSNVPLASPFEERYSNTALTFNYLLKGINDYVIQFEYDKNLNETDIITRFKNTIEIMKIKEAYQNHIDIVEATIHKKQVYNKNQICALLESFPKVFKNEDEVLSMIYGENVMNKKFDQTPLSKLTNDILETLTQY